MLAAPLSVSECGKTSVSTNLGTMTTSKATDAPPDQAGFHRWEFDRPTTPTHGSPCISTHQASTLDLHLPN